MPIGNFAVGPAMTSIESEESGMMSKHTQKEIERMRMDGYGPTRIARELGLSINTVKSHIRRHPGMKFHAALHACTTMNENGVQCSAASVKILVHGTRSAFFAATSARMKLVLLSC